MKVFHKPVEKPVENFPPWGLKKDQQLHLQHLPQDYSKKSLRNGKGAPCTVLQHRILVEKIVRMRLDR
jgi:hypothetical protein